MSPLAQPINDLLLACATLNDHARLCLDSFGERAFQYFGGHSSVAAAAFTYWTRAMPLTIRDPVMPRWNLHRNSFRTVGATL
jgi:hypothetical protein